MTGVTVSGDRPARPGIVPGVGWLACIVLALAANVVIVLGLNSGRWVAVALLLWLLPGLALMEWAAPHEITGRLERLGLGAALSLALTTATGLAAAYWPGPLTRAQVLVAADALIVAFLVAAWLRHRRDRATDSLGGDGTGVATTASRSHDLSRCDPIVLPLLLAILVLAAFLRFSNLGYSEFQGDEALVAWDAARAIGGEDDILFLHGKSPSEVLAPAQGWVLDGRIDEAKARFPFAWAGWVAVLGAYLLGRRWFGPRAGLLAAFLFAINGYFIAFSRVVQYQSWVAALSLFAVYAAYRAWADRLCGYQWLSAVLLAGALWAHYDGLLAAPVVLGLWVLKLRRDAGPRRWVMPAASLALCVGLAAAYYVPFALNPQFGQTASYLGGSRVGKAWLNNNAPLWLLSATVYNSSYYVALCVASVLGLMVAALRRRRAGLIAVVLLAAGMAATIAWPAVWQVGPLNLACVPFALAFLAAWLGARGRAGERVAWAWFGLAFLAYVFVLAKPLSHVYTIVPGWLLLTASGLDRWVVAAQARLRPASAGPAPARVPARVFALVALVALAALTALCIVVPAVLAFYPYAVFVRHEPEFRQAYTDQPVPGYWRPYSRLPEVGLFGFPHRSGWKAIGALYDRGVLKGDFLSNEEEWVSLWYTHFAPTSCRPDARYYFLARNAWDPTPAPRELLDARYAQVGTVLAVLAERQPRLEIWGRRPVDPLEPEASGALDVDALGAEFDAMATPDRFVQKSVPDHALNATLRGPGAEVTLLGYDLDAAEVAAGDAASLTLYWRAEGSLSRDLHVVVRLDDAAAQVDTVPVCGRLPTTLWRPGQVVQDRHRLDIKSNAAVGPRTLTVGLYAPDGDQRLEPAEVPITEIDVVR